MRLGLREANRHFSKAIKAVRAGKDVVLTERGRPIAVIKPLDGADARDAALQAMIDEGLVTPAQRKRPMPPPRWTPLKLDGEPLSHTVVKGRDERV